MLSGNSIAELSSAKSFSSNDIFLVSQRDIYVHDKFKSRHITKNMLVDALLSSIKERRDFGDAASCNIDEFSNVDHSHDNLYNKLSVTYYDGYPEYHMPYPPPSPYESQQETGDTTVKYSGGIIKYPLQKSSSNAYLSIGNIFYDGTLCAVNVPLSAVYDYAFIPWQTKEPQIGSLRFFNAMAEYHTDVQYNPNIKNVYTAPGFDGWLYPNGDTFDLSDFSLSDDLMPLYGNKDSDGQYTGTFTLPTLSNFIHLTGDIRKGLKWHDKNNVLNAHAHSLDLIDVGGYISLNGTAPYSKDAGKSNTIHRGCGQVQTGTASLYGGGSKELWCDINTLLNTKKDDAYKSYSAYRKRHNIVGGQPNHPNNLSWLSCHTYFSNSVEMSCWNFKINIENLNITSVKTDNGETYPTHFKMPVMIYVGRRR